MVWSFYGNLTKNVAVKIAEDARTSFGIKCVARWELQDSRVVCLPKMTNANQRLDFPVVDESNENSVLLSYFQVGVEGENFKTRLLNDIVLQYMEEPTFNQLRTIEQLGYVVFARTT